MKRAMVMAMLAAAVCLAAYPVIEINKLVNQPYENSYTMEDSVSLVVDQYSTVYLSAPTRTGLGYPMYATNYRDNTVTVFSGKRSTAVSSRDDNIFHNGHDRFREAPWDDYSEQGVKVVYSEDKQYLLWVDASGHELNRLPRSPFIYDSYSFGKGNYWLVCEKNFDREEYIACETPFDFLEAPRNGFLVESYFPGHNGIIVTDKVGNKLFERELDGELGFFTPSPMGNILWLQTINENQFLSIRNQVIYKTRGSQIHLPVVYSPSEDVALLGQPYNYVVDMSTGEIIAQILGIQCERQSRMAISDRESGYAAGYSFDTLYLINYQHNIMAQVIPEPSGSVQISGDGIRFGYVKNGSFFTLSKEKK